MFKLDCCSCLPCFKKPENEQDANDVPVANPAFPPLIPGEKAPASTSTEVHDASTIDTSNIEAKSFTFRELATATKHFRQQCLLNESGSGRVFKGTFQNGQVYSVKQLDKNSTDGAKEFLAEVLTLSLLRHSNLLGLVGYCADGDQRLLVYEYMQLGSVEKQLLDADPEKEPLDWSKRMRIASGVAQGLAYLHDKANPPIIYRDLRCTNIMLDDDFNPKLADYGLSKLGGNNKSHMTVMGSYGYAAPEYERHGELTFKSDVYNFGVILLELITGRRAMDTSLQADQQNLVTWAQPIFRDPKRFPELADPRLTNAFPVKALNQVVGVTAMCLQDEPDCRPLISDVVDALSTLPLTVPEEPVKEEPVKEEPVQEEPIPDMKAPSKKEMRAPSRRGSNKSDRLKATSRKKSRRDTADQSGENSSESSWSDYEELEDTSEDDENDFIYERSESDYESGSSGMDSDFEEEEDDEESEEEEYEEEEEEEEESEEEEYDESEEEEEESEEEEEEEESEEESEEEEEESEEEEEEEEDDEDHEDKKEEDSITYPPKWGFMDSKEFEVASMSSSSSKSDDESKLPSTSHLESKKSKKSKSTKNVHFQDPSTDSSSKKSPLKVKSKSTKKPKEGGVHLRRSTTTTIYSTPSKKNHLASKRRSSIKENTDSSHPESDNGKKKSIASCSRRKSRKSESDKEKNVSIASSSRRKSSSKESDATKSIGSSSRKSRSSSSKKSRSSSSKKIRSSSSKKSRSSSLKKTNSIESSSSSSNHSDDEKIEEASLL